MDDRRKGKGSSRPKPSVDIQISKTLSYVLRHGAAKEGLAMRLDGYVKVEDLLKSSKFRSVSFLQIEAICRNDSKGRYNLIFEPALGETGEPSIESIWWIRANQGHSMETVDVELTPVTDPSQYPIVVHGTNNKAWESIKVQGLSRMNRNHIHFAQGLPGTKGVISGMRSQAAILIYINLPIALMHGLKFSVSSNGVILSTGDESGYIKPEFFLRVETAWNHLPLPGWEAKDERTGVEKLAVFDANAKKNSEALGHAPGEDKTTDPVKELVTSGSAFPQSA